MTFVSAFVRSFIALSIDAAPWLLLGLLVAGLVKAWIPTALLRRWLGGGGVGSIVKAAIIGTPLPLCSCSVIPVAMGLRRGGASKGATVSFLVATPENGVDSLAISYALLGPFLTIVRPVAAIISAIVAGILAEVIPTPDSPTRETDESVARCCGTRSSDCCTNDPAAAENMTHRGQLASVLGGVKYAMTDLLDDLAPWLLVGLVLAAIVNVIIPPESLARWGSGPLAMIVMVLVGVPMYVCASASTPIAAAMLTAGVSPGVVLVFLLAGPATNLGTIGILRRELGTRTLLAYLIGVCGTPIIVGLVLDRAFEVAAVHTKAQCMGCARVLPTGFGILAAVVLCFLALPPLRRRFMPK
jgi:uncharacterized membrane protein YraQ (UPF0718 family)